MIECPYCGGDENKCDFSFSTETCSQMKATQDNRPCAVRDDGSVAWDVSAVEILKRPRTAVPPAIAEQDAGYGDLQSDDEKIDYAESVLSKDRP